MNDWQRGFLQKLESAKRQWLHRFEQFALDRVDPVFVEFDAFTTGNGFNVTSPECEPGTRLYKFALTENGYVLIMFKMKGLEEVEVCCEPCVPGVGSIEPQARCTVVAEASEDWVEEQFRNALDQFVLAFTEAGAANANQSDLLVRA